MWLVLDLRAGVMVGQGGNPSEETGRKEKKKKTGG
jgi:hypothetical protein